MNNNVRKFRVERGLTQVELAQELGISRTTMINIENHLYPGIKKSVLKKLCNFFKTTPVRILGLANLKYIPENIEDLNWLIDELIKEKEKWEENKSNN